jgi:hypothetical protein
MIMICEQMGGGREIYRKVGDSILIITNYIVFEFICIWKLH